MGYRIMRSLKELESNQDNHNAFTTKYRRKKRRAKKPYFTENAWVKNSSNLNLKKNVILNNTNFPSLNPSFNLQESNQQLEEKENQIKYDIKQMFEKRKYKKNKEKEVKEGWIKLYYKKKKKKKKKRGCKKYLKKKKKKKKKK